ncbi:hypothetical protein PILCRDRAFT_16525 [Piloderma croceum F 1598]|uniref:Uncharacterized protein n=1 Tax=Piloderma croceum (strain F 1598) TaxID=765440 RepID=A0A0C3EH60_PILCF|nr:hypothetical protein PILCRDRAFT_16525 [Piloderma croceum F 1598]
MSDIKGKKSISKSKKTHESIIRTRAAHAKDVPEIGDVEHLQPLEKSKRAAKRTLPDPDDIKTEDAMELLHKKPKVLPSVARPATTSAHRPTAGQNTVVSTPKRGIYTSRTHFQTSDDDMEELESVPAASASRVRPRSSGMQARDVSQTAVSSTRAVQSHNVGRQFQSSELEGETDSHVHNFGDPPLPPPGQEGRGSYVWVPNTGSDNNCHDVPVQEQLDTQTFVADVAEEDNDGSVETASEELYEDPYAADVRDFPDGDDNNEREMEDIGRVAKQQSAVAGPSTSKVYLEDIESPGLSKPTGCEIWALFNSEDDYKKLMDPMLKSKYQSLPPLRWHTLSTWRSDNEVTGLIMWGSWRHQLDKPNMKYLSKFINFQSFDKYINPARADPNWFGTQTSDNYLYTLKLRQRNRICLCLSPVSGNNILVKSLECIFHSYEWKRSSSFWCTVFGVDTMQAQLNGGTISIETKPSNPNKMVEMESSAPGLFSITASPKKKKAGGIGTGDVKIQLRHTDTIPIFDGRQTQFELDDSLERLDELLPPFEHEIPTGSLVLVAYMANSYYRAQKVGKSGQKSSSNQNLALNINWAIVLGVPK